MNIGLIKNLALVAKIAAVLMFTYCLVLSKGSGPAWYEIAGTVVALAIAFLLERKVGKMKADLAPEGEKEVKD